MPIGTVETINDSSLILILQSPEAHTLEADTPATIWRYDHGTDAIARVRGVITEVGDTHAAMAVLDQERDEGWDPSLPIYEPASPVYCAQPDSYQPAPRGWLATPEELEVLRARAALMQQATGHAPAFAALVPVQDEEAEAPHD